MASKPTYEELEQRVKDLERAELKQKRSRKMLRQNEDGLKGEARASSNIKVSGINITWDTQRGTCTFENLPVAMMWVDTTLAGVMAGVQAMVGTKRFALALQSEGRKSVEADWQVISQFPDFYQGFKAIANIASVAGWGEWVIASLDEQIKECRFRVRDSWEGRYQRALGECWGSAMLAGKMAGYCSKLFGTNCWADQTAFIAKGDPHDEFVVQPSSRSIEKEIEGLLASDEATRADMAVALQKLKQEITQRSRIGEALRQEQDLLKRVIETSPAGITTVNQQGQITFANAQAETVLGLTKDAIIQRTYNEPAWHITDYEGNPLPDEELPFRRVMATGQPVHDVRHAIEWPDGRKVFLSTNAAPLFAQSGEVNGMVATVEDITEWKRAEEEKERLRTQLANAVEMARLGPWEYDVPSDLFTFNDHFYKIFRTTAEQVGGYTMSSAEYARRFVHPDDMTVVAEEIRKAIETMDPNFSRKLEHRMLYADGTVGHISVQLFIVKDAQGQTIKTYGVIQDITDRKRAEKVQFEALARFSGFAEASQYGMGMADLDGHIVYVNSTLARMLGEECPDDCLGKHFPTAYYPSLMTHKLQEEVMPTLMRDGYWHGELELLTKDERCVPTDENYFVIPDENGRPLYLADILTDITERKRAEEALRMSEARFREMADLLPQAVYEANAQGTLTYVNRHAFSIFGHTEEDFEKGLNVLQMLIPEDRDRAADAYREGLKGNLSGINRKYRAQRKDGTSFPVEIYSSLIVHEGTTIGLRGILVDMSEHEEAVAEKDKLQAQLNQAQKMESVGRLAGGVAHDFNNMLGIIMGNAELAMMQMDPTETSLKNIQEILKASHRSAELVRQLLTFARKQTVIPEVLDLNDTVSGMLKMLRRLIGEDIDLAWMPGHDLWHVKIDPSQIDQILANLVVNARDAIAGVGKITIETDNTTLDEVYCGDHLEFEPGQYVLLAVSDNGSGMSRKVLEHLFEPFFTTKELGKGTGLGLSSVYGAVKQNGGFINVYSESGKGTTFKIYLPRIEVKDAATQVKIQPEPLQRGSETVLMVEDEAPILETGKAMLEALGYKVLAANTPDKAIRLAGEDPGSIHLLFTDVVMPGMNGKELEGRIKAIHPRLKCLYMSGYTANAIVHHGVLDEGVNFIHKPFTMKELAARVREALGKD